MSITKADREAWRAAKERYERTVEQSLMPPDQRDPSQALELTQREQDLLWGDGRTPEEEPDWETVDEGLPEQQRPMG